MLWLQPSDCAAGVWMSFLGNVSFSGADVSFKSLAMFSIGSNLTSCREFMNHSAGQRPKYN